MIQFKSTLDTDSFHSGLRELLGKTRIGLEKHPAGNGIGPRVSIVIYSDVQLEDFEKLRDALHTMIAEKYGADVAPDTE